MKTNFWKKAAALTAAASLTLCLAACSQQQKEEGKPEQTGSGDAGQTVTLKVGASPSPHGQLLEQAKPILAEQAITLEIQQFTDYILPNEALEQGELDANFFQHQPYLEEFNQKHGTHLVSLGAVHFEAMGIYGGKCDSLEQLPQGAKVGVPSDVTNEARALQLLADKGLIALKEGAGLEATAKDIVENPKEIQIVEMEAANLPRSLPDLDIAVVNGNYAIDGQVIDRLIESESAQSEAAQTFANIVAVREGDDRPELKKLLEALQSQPIEAYIAEEYSTVFPAF